MHETAADTDGGALLSAADDIAGDLGAETPYDHFPRPIDELSPLQRVLWDEIRTRIENAEDIMRTILYEESLVGTSEDWSLLMERTRAAVITHRSLQEVAQMHGMKPRELMALVAGKRMLNIGAGGTTIAQELSEANALVELTSVDIDKATLLGQPGNAVHADAASLPFDDGSFDIVWMTCSLPLWANSEQQAVAALDEALRVTACGGLLKIAPIAQANSRRAIDKHTGIEILGTFSEEDPRLRYILHAIDLAMLQWIWQIASDDRYEVTLEAGSYRASMLELVTSITIRRR